MQENIRKILTNNTQTAVAALFKETKHFVAVSKVDNELFGDYATNIALILAKELSQNPMEIAERLVAKLNPLLVNVATVSAVKPGFINFSLTKREIINSIKIINNIKVIYGENTIGEQKKVSVEFVSANPTGPLHIGNMRGGLIGDVLANVLAKSGYQVTREYYHNDLGVQVTKLGESILYYIKKLCGEEATFPEDGYEGSYVKDIAKKLEAGNFGETPQNNSLPLGVSPLKDSRGQTPTKLGKIAVDYYKDEALKISETLGIGFDIVTNESEIKNTKNVVEELTKKGFIKEKDGALWFAPNDEYLKDRECVVKKSGGSYGYFANDIAYHLDKKQRGADIAIDILGANHFGHVPRMQAAMKSLGLEGFLKIVLYQWVTLIRNGQEVGMSKRKGNFVTVQEVLDEVGKDALRWFFLDKDSQSHIKFDLDLAKKQSKENPVYYVQYAHARMCSVLVKGSDPNTGSERSKGGPTPKKLGFDPIERSLIRELIYFPDLVEDIARTYKVHELTAYALRLADKFHKFYEFCPILGSPQEKQRLEIVKASKQVLKNTLDLLGISAPEKM